tara:strand:- start:10675 stop:10872 length:198 start_codon:yes stop_codon:yes gene_type:complete
MKWETKDKLLKVGFILSIIVMVVGISMSFKECQRDVVKSKWYGEPTQGKDLQQKCSLINKCIDAE